MNTKLTLRLDDRLIDRAKRYSHRSGKSVSSSSRTTSLSSRQTSRSRDGAYASRAGDDRRAQGRLGHRSGLPSSSGGEVPVNVLFDTNVILDVLLEREPHVEAAAKLFALVDNGRVKGSICATTATTVYYIAAKSFGNRRARDQVHGLLGLFEVAPVGMDVLDKCS